MIKILMITALLVIKEKPNCKNKFTIRDKEMCKTNQIFYEEKENIIYFNSHHFN